MRNIEKATVNGKLTSEYILDFENKKGTPSNEVEEEYLEIINVVRGHLQHYEQALTPPTQEEVCKALSEYYGGDKVAMTKQWWSSRSVDLRIMLKGETKYHLIAERNSLSKTCNIIAYLPPHLITLIGRFYEGLEDNDS